jgi:HPt (histidine-containing phosphotransfer) domain-containing protein
MPDYSAPNLDLTFLYEIADGSNEFIVESIDMFLQHTPALLKEINEAIAAGNWPVAAAAAHKLKPNLGFFGMLDSQALAQEVEYMAKTGNPAAGTVQEKFQTLDSSLQDNLNKLNQIKAEAETQL